MKNIKIILISFLIFGCAPTATIMKTEVTTIKDIETTTTRKTVSTLSVGWFQVWGDEFNYDGLPNPEKWNYENGMVRNNEEQYYTKKRLENIRVENGNLIIEARKEDYKGAKYTSGSLLTRGLKDFRYGRFEVKAKLPKGKGVWPGLWTTGSNYSDVLWPKCGEIDILEFVGKTPNKLYATVHYSNNENKHVSDGGSYNNFNSDGFNIYAIEWNEKQILFFFNDIQYFSFDINKANIGDYNSFKLKHIFRICFALGGWFGGEIDDSILPQKFVIDYVRVYKKITKENQMIYILPLVLSNGNYFDLITSELDF